MYSFFFFNDTATTEIYTLSLHDALPISDIFDVQDDIAREIFDRLRVRLTGEERRRVGKRHTEDRKSTRLNSSHANISYAVFCLKKNTAYLNPHAFSLLLSATTRVTPSTS